MTTVSIDLEKKKVVVVGLARTGAAVARFLLSRGAEVTVTDMQDENKLAAWLEKLSSLPVRYNLGGHDIQLFRQADLIVVSPGVPMDIPALGEARLAGRPVISEVELASWFIEAPMVAITGTNGKTTTTTLTGEIFKSAGARTFVGGNIGNPLIELVEEGKDVQKVVVELSSFQLEGIQKLRPHVAVLLNITEDHLDRYSSYQEYIDAKARVFSNQMREDFAVLNMDDPLVAPFAGKVASRVVPMTQRRELQEGIYSDGQQIVWRWDGRSEAFPLSEVRLKGVHNVENIMAALASTLLLGCPAEAARKVLVQFSGLPHRMEFSGTVSGVPYYDDSKGTNVGSVVKSLQSFSGNITLIAGGKDKGGDYSPLVELVKERVPYLILIGEAKERIRGALGAYTDVRMAATLEEAVRIAADLTSPGGVVLLSPACSSFDMFTSYGERGDRFKTAVKELAKERGA